MAGLLHSLLMRDPYYLPIRHRFQMPQRIWAAAATVHRAHASRLRLHHFNVYYFNLIILDTCKLTLWYYIISQTAVGNDL